MNTAPGGDRAGTVPDVGGTVSFLIATELAKSVGEEDLRDLVGMLEVCSIGDGTELMREGEAGTDLFLVVTGKIIVTVSEVPGKEPPPVELGAGQTVGEMAFLTGDRRSATARACGAATLLRMSREAFEVYARSHNEAARAMTLSLMNRLRRIRLSSTLRRNRIFGERTEEVIPDVESEFETETISGGEVLFRQGEPGDALYFVVAGRLRVVLERANGSTTCLAELGPGEIVGEMAVVTGESRTATVYCIRDTLLARLSRESYQRLLRKHPDIIGSAIMTRIIAKLRQSNSGAAAQLPPTTSIAVIPAGPDVPLTRFCKEFSRALSRFGPTLHLTSESLDGHLEKRNISQAGPHDLDNFRIVQWLAKAEAEHKCVVYEANPISSNWNWRCLRQADHVVIVGSAASDPRPGVVEQQLFSRTQPEGARCSLALLHQPSTVPSNTLEWLKPRKVDRHYHIRLGSEPDIQRLGRFFAGRALGLALGGGFARGLAHVGVFRALEDFGISVDAIGGTSMGAVVGALWAQGWSHERIVEETSAGCVGALNDLTFPFVAFHGGGKFSRAIRRFTGEIQIEDLLLPYFCVSANLNRAELKLHTRGSLMKAVLATTRAPGIFPPVVYDGELHVDGGVLNNVPVDLLKQFCLGGIVVGVDVSPPHELNPVEDYGLEMSGWEAIRRRFGRFGREKTFVPSILLVMMRALEFGGIAYKKLIADSADLYLQPPLLQFKRTDFQLGSQIVEVSYRYAREQIQDWLSRDACSGARVPVRST